MSQLKNLENKNKGGNNRMKRILLLKLVQEKGKMRISIMLKTME